MQFQHMKMAIIAGWVLILAAIAAPLTVASATGWLLVVGVVLLPVMMRFRAQMTAHRVSGDGAPRRDRFQI